jgi:23S rRNA (cytosine1962-C5)-methyltransferase
VTSVTEPTVTITPRGEERLRGGHPWIYQSDLRAIRATGGDTVAVLGPRNRLVGRALYSDRSQIALRLLTMGDVPSGLELWRTRLAAAIAFRRSLNIDATACRLVHCRRESSGCCLTLSACWADSSARRAS